ncbi:receptor-type tyrosine-protein phosphatase delta [Hyalella azteca]|uniref:Receptor-type tyrosine-protein phosphatase delta n=1 Tax=Hyalella azteca TaxID=294128 RepID=A0A8B7NXY9_HYAAZ|nr:receptor-type tyrosine-protein phosphatase delta [Hyalella azteca]
MQMYSTLVFIYLLLQLIHGGYVASSNSCGEENFAEISRGCNLSHCLIVQTKIHPVKHSEMENIDEFCGYSYNTMSDTQIPPHKSYSEMQERIKNLPSCSEYDEIVALFYPNGSTAARPITERYEVAASKAEPPVANLTVAIDNRDVLIAWEPPVSLCPITSYNISITYTDPSTFPDHHKEIVHLNASLQDHQYRISAAHADALYHVCVAAEINLSVSAEQSCVRVKTPGKALPAPRDLRLLNSTSTSLTVAWQLPDGISADEEVDSNMYLGRRETKISNFEIAVTDNSTAYAPVLTYSLPGDFKAFIIEQLKPETRYQVAIRANYEEGMGPFTGKIFLTGPREDSTSTERTDIAVSPAAVQSNIERDNSFDKTGENSDCGTGDMNPGTLLILTLVVASLFKLVENPFSLI